MFLLKRIMNGFASNPGFTILHLENLGGRVRRRVLPVAIIMGNAVGVLDDDPPRVKNHK